MRFSSLDQDQAVFNIETMEQLVSDSMALRRFSMFLLGVFAALALILAAIGIYGVLAQSVVQRTHEIGIRMALGAQARDVLKLIVRQGMTLTLVGIGAGLAGAFALTRLLASLLFGVGATDPSTFLWIPVLLGCVSFFACYIPARRAARLIRSRPSREHECDEQHQGAALSKPPCLLAWAQWAL